MISCSQLVYGFGQSSRDCSVSTPNLRDDLSCLLGWDSHGGYTSVCGYTLDKNYRKSWCKATR